MGMTAATKLRALVENAELISAIELITAAEGLEYRAPLRAGRGVHRAFEIVRAHVTRLENDRSMSNDIQTIAGAIRSGEFDAILNVTHKRSLMTASLMTDGAVGRILS